MDQAVYVVAVLANRSAAELHRLANAQATATKGEPSWGNWASLQNAARRLVLDATSARDGAAKLGPDALAESERLSEAPDMTVQCERQRA